MSAPFASRITKTLELPFDPPQTVTIRKLPGRHLEAAARERVFSRMEAMRRMGGPSFQRELQAAIAEEEREAEAAGPATSELESAPAPAAVEPDPLLGYDKDVLLVRGIAAWSYPEPVTPELIEDLEADAAEWIAREILRLTKPSLFQTAEELEAATKNG